MLCVCMYRRKGRDLREREDSRVKEGKRGLGRLAACVGSAKDRIHAPGEKIGEKR